MRQSYTFHINKPSYLSKLLLSKSKEVDYISILDSNTQITRPSLPADYINYDLLAGVDALKVLEVSRDAFNQLKKFHQQHQDWLFGYLSYDLKNEVEELTSTNHDGVQAASLSFFIPLIMATAGNVGIQSSSIVIQSLSNPSAFENTVLNRLFKVLYVSILNGIVLAFIVYFSLSIFDYLNFLNLEIYSKTTLIVSISLFSIVLVSSILGTITPIILNRLKFNPALASGPFITTTNDLIALAIYFLVAILIGGI